MEFLTEHKSEYAVLMVRLITGILFFAQGYDKVFRLQLNRTADASVNALRPLGISSSVIRFVAVITSLAEFAGGILLIAGFMIIPTSYVLIACLLPVTIAMSWREPMWNLQQVWVRLVMLTFLLLIQESLHVISIDGLLNYYAG